VGKVAVPGATNHPTTMTQAADGDKTISNHHQMTAPSSMDGEAGETRISKVKVVNGDSKEVGPTNKPGINITNLKPSSKVTIKDNGLIIKITGKTTSNKIQHHNIINGMGSITNLVQQVVLLLQIAPPLNRNNSTTVFINIL